MQEKKSQLIKQEKREVDSRASSESNDDKNAPKRNLGGNANKNYDTRDGPNPLVSQPNI